MPLSSDNGDGFWFWLDDVHGEFAVSAAYHLLCSPNYDDYHDLKNKIWKNSGARKRGLLTWTLRSKLAKVHLNKSFNET